VSNLKDGSTSIRGEHELCFANTQDVSVTQPLRRGHGSAVAEDRLAARNGLQKDLTLGDPQMGDRTENGPSRNLDISVGTTNRQGKIPLAVLPRGSFRPQLKGEIQICSSHRTSSGFEIWFGETVSRRLTSR
jgi:hypothetical protein